MSLLQLSPQVSRIYADVIERLDDAEMVGDYEKILMLVAEDRTTTGP